MAGLIATSPAGSLFLCVTTGAIFILGWDGLGAVLGGMTIGVLGWLAMGAAVTSFLPVDRANRSIHTALTMRMDAMRAGPMPPAAESHLDARASSLRAIGGRAPPIDHATAEFTAMNPSLEWALGYGYVRLWERLHRAEEEQLFSAPPDELIAEATRDTLRLKGSNIDNRDQLLDQLQRAASVVAFTAGVSVGVIPGSSVVGLAPPFHAADDTIARQMIRQVRRAINEFRDDRRLALVRARNQLLRTIILTAFVTYQLLVLAILAGVPRPAFTSAIAFFLVGATVGLFNRLYLDASTETAVEDYGLSASRLLHTPLLCGLAAVGGALIVPLLSVQINPTIDASAATIAAPTLTAIFDIAQRPFALVLAAVFGLTPSALISRLQSEAEKYKSDLKTSETPAAR
jgi:hypothetical protein